MGGVWGWGGLGQAAGGTVRQGLGGCWVSQRSEGAEAHGGSSPRVALSCMA